MSQWTAEERIAFVVENAAGKVPGELGQALLALLSPENLALMVLVAGLFIGAHAIGWGLLADVAIVAVAYMYAGFYAVLALKDLGECFARTASAQSEQDLGIAADALVRAVAGIGVAGLSAILHRVATRQAGEGLSATGKAGNATKQSSSESRPAGRAAEKPPMPTKPASETGGRQSGAGSAQSSIASKVANPIAARRGAYDAVERPRGVPGHWLAEDGRKIGHKKWVNPENKHDYVRLKPDGTVTQVRDGLAFDAEGNQVRLDSKEAHGIKFEDFMFVE